MRRSLSLALSCLAVLLLAGCASPSGDTPAQKRQAAAQMRSETLAKLYAIRPSARQEIRRAEGYAVFSNVGVNLIFLSAGNGYGVLRDNKTGRDVHMKMVTGGIGLGLGVKDFRGVFVFTTREALDRFASDGWDAGAQADAAAKSSDKGGAYAGAVSVAPGIELYQITENGLALQATIQGTKYWRDDDLS